MLSHGFEHVLKHWKMQLPGLAALPSHTEEASTERLTFVLEIIISHNSNCLCAKTSRILDKKIMKINIDMISWYANAKGKVTLGSKRSCKTIRGG